MTTFEPGANEDLTQGLRSSPSSRALRATSPAPIMTSGLDVLVHEVIAAMTTSPSVSRKRSPSTSTSTPVFALSVPASTAARPRPPSPATVDADDPVLAEELVRSDRHCVAIADRAMRS